LDEGPSIPIVHSGRLALIDIIYLASPSSFAATLVPLASILWLVVPPLIHCPLVGIFTILFAVPLLPTAHINLITFFKRGLADPSQQCKIVSNSIQDPPPRWILTIFKLKFGGGNLFSQAMTSFIEGNNSVGSLLKPLLKKVTPVVGSRMLCSPTSQPMGFFFLFRDKIINKNLTLEPYSSTHI
jgi:hypothetical protein